SRRWRWCASASPRPTRSSTSATTCWRGGASGRVEPVRQVRRLPSDRRNMEAATPLRKPSVRTVGDRVAVDGLVVEDEATLRLVREREDANEDTVKLILDAIGIGARVLDREQAGANAEAVKAEMDRAARELNDEFAERARAVAETL